MSKFDERAREIVSTEVLGNEFDGYVVDEHRLASAISAALEEAYEMGRNGESLRDRVVVNEAPSGSSPSGLPSLSQQPQHRPVKSWTDEWVCGDCGIHEDLFPYAFCKQKAKRKIEERGTRDEATAEDKS